MAPPRSPAAAFYREFLKLIRRLERNNCTHIAFRKGGANDVGKGGFCRHGAESYYLHHLREKLPWLREADRGIFSVPEEATSFIRARFRGTKADTPGDREVALDRALSALTVLMREVQSELCASVTVTDGIRIEAWASYQDAERMDAIMRKRQDEASMERFESRVRRQLGLDGLDAFEDIYNKHRGLTRDLPGLMSAVMEEMDDDQEGREDDDDEEEEGETAAEALLQTADADDADDADADEEEDAWDLDSLKQNLFRELRGRELRADLNALHLDMRYPGWNSSEAVPPPPHRVLEACVAKMRAVDATGEAVTSYERRRLVEDFMAVVRDWFACPGGARDDPHQRRLLQHYVFLIVEWIAHSKGKEDARMELLHATLQRLEEEGIKINDGRGGQSPQMLRLRDSVRGSRTLHAKLVDLVGEGMGEGMGGGEGEGEGDERVDLAAAPASERGRPPLSPPPPYLPTPSSPSSWGPSRRTWGAVPEGRGEGEGGGGGGGGGRGKAGREMGHMFSYRIRIGNVGSDRVQLLGRTWQMFDDGGNLIQVRHTHTHTHTHTRTDTHARCFE